MSGNTPFTIEDRESLRRGSLVSKLLNVLPWRGDLAALDYSFRDNTFAQSNSPRRPKTTLVQSF